MGVIRKTVKINDESVDLEVEYDYVPGHPETPPAYSHGGLPPEPSEITFTKVTAFGIELLDKEEALSEKVLDELYAAIDEQEIGAECCSYGGGDED